ncbi:MAG: hypothetical protein JSR54_15540, partial [Proteobacteria bacterium]|nr:hypothetical protein [Pseudomonadota bacterium]
MSAALAAAPAARAPRLRYAGDLEPAAPSLLGAIVYGSDARAECGRSGD